VRLPDPPKARFRALGEGLELTVIAGLLAEEAPEAERLCVHGRYGLPRLALKVVTLHHYTTAPRAACARGGIWPFDT
jgi:hypothetical protein